MKSLTRMFVRSNWRETREERSTVFGEMVSEENLIHHLIDLNSDSSFVDKYVLDKCLQICIAHDVTEEEFVQSWLSYTKKYSVNSTPTINELNKFENLEFKENNANSIREAVKTMTVNDEEIDLFTNVLDLYENPQATPIKQTKSIKRARSPSQETQNDCKLRAVERDFTPSTYEPSPNVPNRAPSTIVRGKILLSFGPKVENWKKENEELSILKADVPLVPQNAQYMYEMLDRQRQLLIERCETFGQRLCEIWQSTEPDDSDVRSVKNIMARPATLFRTYGRISIKVEEGTRKKIILLEGCEPFRGSSQSTVVYMNFDALKSYAIFPGQILGVEGVLSIDGVLTATKLFTKGHVRSFDAPKLCKDIKIYVAAGPFTPISDLNYQPLWDFMERVAEDEPDVLVLIGPFMEADHSCSRDLHETFGDFFHKLLSKILHYLQGKFTRVILVPSYRDAHHDLVFPTPEFVLNSSKLGPTSTIVHCMPDPCIINMNGLHIGITSVDTLKHFGLKELSFHSATDRISRLADHLLSQASFYPMYPYLKGLPFDITLWKEYGCFSKQPHIMILPSDIKFYCKSINNCFVINPERLYKYNYARICIRPARNDKWDPNDVSCEIAKV